MTREEKLRIFQDAQARAFEVIDKTPGEQMDSEEFSRLLDAVYRMRWMEEEKVELFDDFVSDGVQEKPPAEESAPEEVQPEPELGMTKEALKEHLITLSNKHDALDVSVYMNEMGYSKLSDIPASRYNELLAKVEAAVKELK